MRRRRAGACGRSAWMRSAALASSAASSNSGFGLEHYVKWLQDRGYGPKGCTDWQPDAAAHELGTGKTRVEMLVGMGRHIAMVPRLIRADGISATRLELRRMWFNADTTAHGIEAL